MQAKLTLRVDSNLIEKAKRYSAENGKSLSQIVADHFTALTASSEAQDRSTTPITNSLRGAWKHIDFDEDEYHRYLEEKYR